MSKKNKTSKYILIMDKAKQIIDFLLKTKELIFVISVLFMGLVNIWLTRQLLPFVEADRNAEYRIHAVEKDVSQLTESSIEIKAQLDDIKKDTSFILGKLSK